MIRSFSLRACKCAISALIFSQALHAGTVTLGPFIGLDTPPSNTDSICDIPIFPSINLGLDSLHDGPRTDLATAYVSAGGTLDVSFDFYTGAEPAEGSIGLTLYNNYNPGISYKIMLRACTDAAGVAGTAPDPAFLCYPNPARNILIVHCNSSSGITEISLCNLAGVPVIREIVPVVSGEDIPLDVSALPKGSYILQMRSGKSQRTIQVFIL